MSLETMTKLASTTVGVGGSASVSFTNIPQDYTDLVLKTSTRQSGASSATTIRMGFNGDTGANYSYRFLQGAGSSSATSSFGNNATNTSNETIVNNGAGATASIFASGEICINNYTSFNFKSWLSDSVQENNATTAYSRISAGLWNNSSPITSISLVDSEGSFIQNSTFTLYGIKNAVQTAGNSIKATGGDIIFDGTYVYHVFDSSGVFTPTQPILADYLVVAGGGSGANAGTGGAGGGAGGLRSTVGATGGGGSLESPLSLLSATSYTVTVGAGGAQPTYTNNGNNGSNSTFATIVSTGGGAGAQDETNGFAGGSGGGAGGVANRTGGAASPAGQGNVGGNSLVGSSSNRPNGGGGGAGAAGANGVTNNSGSGGAGVQITAFATPTGTGASGYYAGGGGGGIGALGSTAGTGGLGGGGNGNKVTGAQLATAGTANTGGGGGGIDTQNGGGGSSAGGSGIVIVRYKG